jgi:hypothetical protein
MTIALNDRRARYVATASQTSFDVDFPINTDADVAVYHKVDATGVVTLLTLTTDYTVTLDGAAPNTADVDLVTGAAVDDIITVEGTTSVDRDTDFTTGGDFLAGTVNNAEDRQYAIDQEQKRDLDRMVIANRVSPDTLDTTLPDVVGNGSRFLSLAADGLSFVWSQLTSTVAVLSDTAAEDTGTGAAGTSAEISRADHVHAIPTNGIVSAMITALNVTTGKIAAAAVTASKLGGGTLTSGFDYTVVDDGTKTTGTYTPVYTGGNMKEVVNGGAHTLAPQSGNGVIVVEYTNDGSAGAITTSGFDKVTGDSFTTTNTHVFQCQLTVTPVMSRLDVSAKQ